MTHTPDSHKAALSKLFSGKKARWLPLFSRLLARFSRVPGIDIFPSKTTISVTGPGEKDPSIGLIRITPQGLQIGLALSNAAVKSRRLKPASRLPRNITHQILISEAADLDEEFMTWLKAAKIQARTSKRQST